MILWRRNGQRSVSIPRARPNWRDAISRLYGKGQKPVSVPPDSTGNRGKIAQHPFLELARYKFAKSGNSRIRRRTRVTRFLSDYLALAGDLGGLKERYMYTRARRNVYREREGERERARQEGSRVRCVSLKPPRTAHRGKYRSSFSSGRLTSALR